MPDYKPTVYEQIVIDYSAGKKLNYDDYKDELSARGWSEKRYFDAYIKDLEFINDLMKESGFIKFADERLKDYFSADKAKEIFGILRNIAEIEDEKQKNKSKKKLKNTLTEELENAGYNSKELDAFKKDMAIIEKIAENPNFNLRIAADIVKKYHPSKDEDVLRFSLLDEEKKIVLAAEQQGMFKDGEIIEYEGYDKKIEAHDYLNLPEKADAFVIFSGHPGSAEPAIEAWFKDYKRTGKAKKLVFLGLYDNQGNTDFSQGDLKFNTGSEVEMYVRYCREFGISEEILKVCLVTPTDTSTEDNTQLLAEIRNKFFDKENDVNFVMFGYPAYQKRIASEFSFQFQKMENEGMKNGEKLAPTSFIMPVVKPKQNEAYRYLSYDNLDGIAQDIIMGNCLPHPYRVSAGGRFDSKLGEYPQEFKAYLPISLVYSYPNVANELAGTDIEVGTKMKLLRAIQHEAFGWEDAKKVDNTIMYNNLMLRKKLAHEGLLTADTVFHGNNQSKIDYLREISSAKHSFEDEAKILMGSDKVSPHKIQGVVEYLKNEAKREK